MNRLIVLIIITLQLQWKNVIGAKILMAHPATNFYIGSHVQYQSILSRELVKRGHNVVFLSNSIVKNKGNPEDSYSKMITFNLPLDADEFIGRYEKLSNLVNEKKATVNHVNQLMDFFRRSVLYCQHLWQDEDALTRLKAEDFDLILINPFGQCEYLLHCYLNVPFVVFTPGMRYPTFNEDIFRVPSPASYVPSMMTGFTDDMTFIQRCVNLFAKTIGTAVISYFMIDMFAELKDEVGVCPEMSLMDLNRKAELWLTNSDIAADFSQPYSSNSIPIGGLTAEPAKPLSHELDEFVQGSGRHGLIVVSMGSTIVVSDDDITIFARALARLPQRAILRHRKNLTTGDSNNNVKILSWIPQNDLLGHNATKLFIGHGGLNGIYEAIYHAVPMILIPYGLDQPDNAARMCKKGVALCLDRDHINEDTLMEAITRVLSNKSYQAAASHYSAIHKDQPMTPRERAVFWIEHVIKHGGAHLRHRGMDMNFVQYYMIDVAVFVTVLAALFIVLFFVSVRRCCRCFHVKQKQE